MVLLSKCSSLLATWTQNAPVLNYLAVLQTTRILEAVREYSNKSGDCSKAWVDIPPKVDPKCPKTCEQKQHKKQGIIHRIKLRVLQGGSNFGTPFRRLKCPPEKDLVKIIGDENDKTITPTSKAIALTKQTAVAKAEPKKKDVAFVMPVLRPGVQVAVLGADTGSGAYVALLLKQCPAIRKLRLYEAQDSPTGASARDLGNVVADLKQINTNCFIQSFSSCRSELERCLQNSDIVLIMESGYVNAEMSYEKRFLYQAPIIKQYADAISAACPKAFIIVCATPIDCMVPLVAETLKETNWFDPRKLLGSVAVPEMRASTIAARALCLEPKCTRIPCVGGTEGEALVPLFSKAVELFDFAEKSAMMMTHVVRTTSMAVARNAASSDLSEAHAVARLTIQVAHALICTDITRVTGFVATDSTHMISPAKWLSNVVEIDGHGIRKCMGLPKMNDLENEIMMDAVKELCWKLKMVYEWHSKYLSCSARFDGCELQHFYPSAKSYQIFEDCAYAVR